MQRVSYTYVCTTRCLLLFCQTHRICSSKLKYQRRIAILSGGLARPRDLKPETLLLCRSVISVRYYSDILQVISPHEGTLYALRWDILQSNKREKLASKKTQNKVITVQEYVTEAVLTLWLICKLTGSLIASCILRPHCHLVALPHAHTAALWWIKGQICDPNIVCDRNCRVTSRDQNVSGVEELHNNINRAGQDWSCGIWNQWDTLQSVQCRTALVHCNNTFL